MSFPDETLELTAEAAFGADLTADPTTWTWTDLSDRLLNDPVSVRRGVRVGASQAQISSATINLTNNDGALTPVFAGSPYYPYVDAGTPFRLRLRTTTAALFQDTFTRTTSGGLGTTDSGHTYTYTGGATADFSTTGTVAQISIATANLTRRASSTYSARDVDVTMDASVPAVATGAVLSVGPHLRLVDGLNFLWPSIEFLTTGTLQYKLWSVVGGTFTSLGQVNTGLAYTAGTTARIRVQQVGDVIRAKLWLASGTEPDLWDSTVRQTTYPDAGRVGIYTWRQAGNTNASPVVYTVDNVQVVQPPYDRIEGYISDIRPVFVPLPGGETWSTVQVDVAGIGSRLEKQESPAYSPMRRSIQLATTTPIAYWPLEDEDKSTYGASAFPGGPRMTVTGPVVFGFSQGTPTEQFLSRYGTKPMASVAAGARLTASVPLSTVLTEWAVSVVAEFFEPDVPAITEMRIMQWDTPSSTINRWAFIATDSGYIVRGYNDSAGTFTDVITYTTGIFVGQATWTVEGHQSGGNIALELFINDNSLGTGSIAGTQAPVSKVSLNPDQTNVTASLTPAGLKFVVGHVRVVDETSVHDTPFYTVPETSTVVSAISAWYQEPAHDRIDRLCDEERVPITILGAPGTTGYTLLNAQQEGAFSDLIATASESESGGLLYEAGFGFYYLPRTARYNLGVALTVDLAVYNRSDDTDQDAVLVPQLDSRAANYWTVKRSNGAEGSYAADTAYRARRGTINQQVTLDVLHDSDTNLHAQWRVHLGTDARDAYYPGLPVDLSANPDLIDGWLACDIGSRVQRTNQPTIAGVGTIDQVIDGYTETISPRSWLAEINASPASVWDVGVWGSSVYSPAASTLQAGITSAALSMSVAGDTWTTGVVSLLLEIGGEHMTVTNIAGTGPYTMTISARSVNGVVAAHSSGAAVHLANPSRYGL